MGPESQLADYQYSFHTADILFGNNFLTLVQIIVLGNKVPLIFWNCEKPGFGVKLLHVVIMMEIRNTNNNDSNYIYCCANQEWQWHYTLFTIAK